MLKYKQFFKLVYLNYSAAQKTTHSIFYYSFSWHLLFFYLSSIILIWHCLLLLLCVNMCHLFFYLGMIVLILTFCCCLGIFRWYVDGYIGKFKKDRIMWHLLLGMGFLREWRREISVFSTYCGLMKRYSFNCISSLN